MGKIALARIDSRLIHGQVCTQWLARLGARRILIIDDDVAADPFLFQVMQLATPIGTKLEVLSTAQAGEKWKENQFGEPDPILILFKSVPMLHKAHLAGCKLSTLQVGGIGGGPGRINVVGPIALDEADAKMLTEMAADGMDIFFQTVPDAGRVSWAEVKNKFFKNLQ